MQASGHLLDHSLSALERRLSQAEVGWRRSHPGMIGTTFRAHQQNRTVAPAARDCTFLAAYTPGSPHVLKCCMKQAGAWRRAVGHAHRAHFPLSEAIDDQWSVSTSAKESRCWANVNGTRNGTVLGHCKPVAGHLPAVTVWAAVRQLVGDGGREATAVAAYAVRLLRDGSDSTEDALIEHTIVKAQPLHHTGGGTALIAVASPLRSGCGRTLYRLVLLGVLCEVDGIAGHKRQPIFFCPFRCLSLDTRTPALPSKQLPDAMITRKEPTYNVRHSTAVAVSCPFPSSLPPQRCGAPPGRRDGRESADACEPRAQVIGGAPSPGQSPLLRYTSHTHPSHGGAAWAAWHSLCRLERRRLLSTCRMVLGSRFDASLACMDPFGS